MVTAESECSSAATITQAYRFAIDPTAEQMNLLRSHVGGSRFAYNALLGIIKANWDENRGRKNAGEVVSKDDYLNTSHFDLLYLWAEHRDQLAPWWAENGTSTYNDAAQRLAKTFSNFHHGRAQFPRFKSRGQGGSVRFTYKAVRLADSHHVRVSRIGEIKTYESTRKLSMLNEAPVGSFRPPSVSALGNGQSPSPLRFNARSPRPEHPGGS